VTANKELTTQITAQVMKQLQDIGVCERTKTMLINKCIKHMKTVMVGAIAAVEDHMGDMWGHKLMERTPQQEEIYAMWLQTRQAILDKGNTQSRLLLDVIEQLDVRDKVNTSDKKGQ
jgi:hypothetical protein